MAVSSVKEFEDQKNKLDDESLKLLGIAGGRGGIQNIRGDHTEWELYDELRVYLNAHTDQEKFVISGPCLKTPDSKSDKTEEHHIILISKNEKTCYCIESKHSLSTSVKSATRQLSEMQILLQSYFGDQFVSGEWRYVSIIHHVENKSGKKICSECEPFIIKPGEISYKLQEIEKKLGNQVTTANHNEY